MPVTRYRVVFGNEGATASQLKHLEEIQVEQEIDLAWEARLKFAVCLNDQGNWTGEEADFMASFTRVRIEVSVGSAGFVPLIDGPVVGRDSVKSSEPGKSSVTLVVRDDSAYLSREERIERYENLLDHEVAERLFKDPQSRIADVDIDPTEPPTDSLPPVVVRRGTAIQLLRQLARRQGMFAYVLPGEAPGKSIGCFKRLRTEPSDLPPLVLLGKDRNVTQLSVRADDQQLATTHAHAVNITDKGIVSSTSSVRDVQLLGSEARLPDSEQPASRLAPPWLGHTMDIDRRTAASTERSSYGFEATGTVIPGCYEGILRPYLVVSARGLNNRDSGSFLIHKVKHTLTRSTYSQAFTLRRNSRSRAPTQTVNDLVGSIL